MATDLAEFLGAAVGFYLLLGIPLWIAGLLTAVVTFIILSLERYGFRPLELVISGFVGDHRGELPGGDHPGQAADRAGALPCRGPPARRPGKHPPGRRHPRRHGHAARDFSAFLAHAEPHRGKGAGEAAPAPPVRDRGCVDRHGHCRAHQHGNAHHGRGHILHARDSRRSAPWKKRTRPSSRSWARRQAGCSASPCSPRVSPPPRWAPWRAR